MGCIYACTCGNNCIGCSEYSPEKYYGHAEDLAAQCQGYESYDQMLSEQNK
jgi:hypothetical protein